MDDCFILPVNLAVIGLCKCRRRELTRHQLDHVHEHVKNSTRLLP